MSPSPSVPAPASVRRDWLLGPLQDLLLGCGLGYVALVALLALWRPDLSRVQGWLPIVVLATGVPHYGATLLRVYGTKESRRRYARYAVVFTALVWAAFLVGLRVPVAGSCLITLYLTWSPWHYTSQNYGLALMFLGRRGVPVSAGTKRLLRASFVLSYALVFLAYHRTAAAGGRDPMYAASESYRFLPLGIPDGVTRGLALGLGGLWVAVTGLCLSGLVRASRPRALVPAALLVLTQALWFALPALGDQVAPAGYWGGGAAARAFIWIAIAHSVQYLWVSRYYARTAGGTSRTGGARYYLQVLLAGAAIWTVPALLFAPDALGRVPFEMGLGLLVAAAVNLHHFLIDGAIWKLRDARVGQVLLAGTEASPSAPTAPLPTHRGGPPSLTVLLLGAVGALSAISWAWATWEKEMGQRRAYAAGDLARLERAAGRLALLGRDGPQIHVALGRLKARRGLIQAALVEYQRSLALAPTAAAWVGIGRLREAQEHWRGALDAYQAALGADTGDTAARATAFDRSALLWLRLGEPGRALAASEQALAVAPGRASIQRHHAEVLAAAGRPTPTLPPVVSPSTPGESEPAAEP
jgi:hypothetical protein